MIKNKIMLIEILILLLVIPITFAQFEVNIISEKHDLIDHEIIVEVKNLDNFSKNFNLRFMLTNTNFNLDDIEHVYIYEYKPILKKFPIYSTRTVEKTCFFNQTIDNKTNVEIPYDCSYNETYISGFEYKRELDWIPIKRALDFDGKIAKTEYGNISVPKRNSAPKFDDFNKIYDTDGTKLFKITWKTPIVKRSSGYGSSGYFAIEDANTGINYDPWWNTNWRYKSEIKITNPDDSFIPNFGVRVALNTANLISAGKMKSDCSDIRIVNETSLTTIPHTVTNCNSASTNIYFKINMDKKETTNNIYIYYGNPSATSTNTTLCQSFYIFCDDFESGTLNNWNSRANNGGGWEIYNFGAGYGYVIRARQGTFAYRGAIDTYGKTEFYRTGVELIYDTLIYDPTGGTYNGVGIARSVKTDGAYDNNPFTNFIDTNNWGISNFRIANYSTALTMFSSDLPQYNNNWDTVSIRFNATHIRIDSLTRGNSSTTYRAFFNAHNAQNSSYFIAIHASTSDDTQHYIDNVRVRQASIIEPSYYFTGEESAPTTTTTTTTTIPSNGNITGVEFNDLFNIFKTGFVDGIFGNWFLAGLGLLAIGTWLGVSLGLSIDILLALTLPLTFTLVLTTVLPPLASLIIGLIATVLIYIIYLRLFRR